MHNQNKLLLIGQFSKNPKVYCYADSFAKSLLKLDYDVITFAYYPPLKQNIFQRSFFFLWHFFINIKLLLFCLWHQPTTIFALKAECVFAKTLSLIKRWCAPKIIWFYPDSPFIIWNDNSNSQMLKILPLVDTYLSWSKQLIPLLYHAGAKKVVYFPFGFDSDIFIKKILPQKTEYSTDLLFVGTYEPARERWLTEIVKRKPLVCLTIIGTGWLDQCTDQNHPLMKYIKSDALLAHRLPELFSHAKIILNFLRAQNLDAHNMRSIEVPATGNFLLTERSTEQAKELFEEGKSIACFSSLEELIEKIEYYLLHEEERRMIAEQGYQQAQQYSLDTLLKTDIKNNKTKEQVNQ